MAYLAALTSFPQTPKPAVPSDLTGTWVVDNNKSVAPPGTPQPSQVPLTLRQTATTVEMERLGRTTVYRFVGDASKGTPDRPEFPASWDGKQLTINTTNGSGKKVTARWYLESEFLVSSVGEGPDQVKRYFRRVKSS